MIIKRILLDIYESLRYGPLVGPESDQIIAWLKR